MQKIKFSFLIILMFSAFSLISQNYSPCEKGKLFGVCHENGKVVIPQVYQSVYPFYNYPDRFLVELNKKYGVLDTANKVLLAVEYEFDMEHSNPFVIDGEMVYIDSSSSIILKRKAKYGILDANLKQVVPFEYDYLGFFHYYSSPSFVAGKMKKFMLIDKSKKVISKPDYLNFAGFFTFSLYNNVYAIFKTPEKWVFVDENGKEYEQALATTQFGNDTVDVKYNNVRYNNKFAAFSYQGHFIAGGYDEMSGFIKPYPENAYEYAVIATKGKYGVLRSDGIEIIKPIYDHIDPVYFSGQACKITQNNKIGIADLNSGKILLAPAYDDIWIFAWLNEVTYARKNGKCGLINNQGKELTNFEFDDIQTYQDKLYGAKKDGKWGYIDLSGKTVIPFEFDNTEGFFNEEIIPLSKNGKFGYVNRNGKNITEFKYDEATRFLNHEKAKITLNGKSGWIDKKGVESWN